MATVPGGLFDHVARGIPQIEIHLRAACHYLMQRILGRQQKVLVRIIVAELIYEVLIKAAPQAVNRLFLGLAVRLTWFSFLRENIRRGRETGPRPCRRRLSRWPAVGLARRDGSVRVNTRALAVPGLPPPAS